MSRLLVVLIMAIVAWMVYQRTARHTVPVTRAPPRLHRDAGLSETFHCDGRRYCSQMTSRAEAEFFTKYCPGTLMDGDGDGIPCENDSRF